MREMFTRLLFTALAITSMFGAYSQSYFKTIDIGGDEYGNVANNADGSNIIIAGSTSKVGAGGYDAMLIKTSANGTTLWEKQYGGSGSESGRYGLHTSDNGYLLVGSSTSYSSSNDVLVVKTDSVGNVIWSKTFGTDSIDYGFRAAEGNDGYLIGGQTFGAPAPDNTKADMLLIKLDYNGNVQWSKSLGSQNGAEIPRDLFYIGPEWVAIGVSGSGLVGANDGVFFLMDSAGNLQGDFLAGGTSDDDFRSLVPMEDGAYLVGSSRSFGVSGDDISVTKYLTNGGPPMHAWMKTYGGTGDESVTSAKKIPGSPYILITGLTTSGGAGTAQEGFALIIDTAGTVIHSKRVGAAGDEVIMDAVMIPQGITLVGYSNSFGGVQNNVFIAQLDSTVSISCNSADISFTAVTQHDSAMGPFIIDFITMDMALDTASVNVTVNSYTAQDSTICGGTPVGIAEINDAMNFELFPNPVSGQLKVAVYSTERAEAQISIYNYLGQTTQLVNTEINSGKNSFTFPVKDLSAGVYFLKISTAQGQVVKSFVVQ